MELTAEERARRVKIIVFDVDGVFTDGQLFFIPVGRTERGEVTAVETKGSQRIAASQLATRLDCGLV